MDIAEGVGMQAWFTQNKSAEQPSAMYMECMVPKIWSHFKRYFCYSAVIINCEIVNVVQSGELVGGRVDKNTDERRLTNSTK